jgi:integrase
MEQVYTVNEILDRYIRDCMDDLAETTKRDYLKHIKHLRQWFGERIAADLKPRDFQAFIEVKGRGRFVRNKRMAVLSSAFTYAVQRWYWIDRNVCKDVWKHPSTPRDRLILQEEFDSLRAMSPLRVQLMMDLALITGQRQGDLLRMRWDSIKDGVLGKCAQLETHGNPREYVILNESGKPYTSDGFRSIWQRAKKRWVQAGNENGTFHDLRAACATRCETIEIASKLLGHSSIAMTRKVYRRGIEYVAPLRVSSHEDHVTSMGRTPLLSYAKQENPSAMGA